MKPVTVRPSSLHTEKVRRCKFSVTDKTKKEKGLGCGQIPKVVGSGDTPSLEWVWRVCTGVYLLIGTVKFGDFNTSEQRRRFGPNGTGLRMEVPGKWD